MSSLPTAAAWQGMRLSGGVGLPARLGGVSSHPLEPVAVGIGEPASAQLREVAPR